MLSLTPWMPASWVGMLWQYIAGVTQSAQSLLSIHFMAFERLGAFQAHVCKPCGFLHDATEKHTLTSAT
jgi:hypothetical protein